MSNYSILRIGPISSDNGNAAVLRDAILSHFQKQINDTPTSSSCTDNNMLSISNRYFNANILLSPLDDDDSTTTEGVEDGIILIFDGTSSSNFDKLTSIHTSAEKEYGDLLRLCISTTYGPSPLTNGTKSSEVEYSKRVLWCLDHGYEYVEANLNEEGMTTGFDERDKDGFARVCEAIGSCMWSCHVMKPRNGVGVSKSGRSSGVCSSEVDNSESQSQDISEDKDGEKDGEAATTVDDAEREEAAVASLMKDMTNPNDTPQPPSNPQEQPQTNHQKEEIAFHQLESVLSEAKSIRDASKGNSMSDDERRERAGDTAMKLMGLLDSMGFCVDSDDDGEGVDSSDDET